MEVTECEEMGSSDKDPWAVLRETPTGGLCRPIYVSTIGVAVYQTCRTGGCNLHGFGGSCHPGELIAGNNGNGKSARAADEAPRPVRQECGAGHIQPHDNDK